MSTVKKPDKRKIVMTPEQQAQYFAQMQRKKVAKKKAEADKAKKAAAGYPKPLTKSTSATLSNNDKNESLIMKFVKPVSSSTSSENLFLLNEKEENQLPYTMNDPLLRGGYLLFLKQAFCPESILCFLELLYYESKFPTMTQEQQISFAMNLVENYLKPNSANEINISDFLRTRVIAHLEQQDKIFKQTGFCKVEFMEITKVKEELFLLMKGDTFLKYTKHKLFERAMDIKNHKIFKKKTTPLKDISPEEWNILMVGAKEQVIDQNQFILKQNELNKYFYRLESGALRVEKSLEVGAPPTKLTVLKDSGTVFGEMSIVSSLPASATIIADTPAVVKRLQAQLILYLLFTTNEGPDLGRRFFSKLGNKLVDILVNITLLEPPTPARLKRPKLCKCFKADSSGEIPRSRSALQLQPSSSPDLNAHSGRSLFKKLFPSFDEPVIEYCECILESKKKLKKGTLFITPKRLCFYHVKLAQKTRAVYPFEEVVIVPLSPSDPKAFSVNVKEKAVIFRFETKESKKYCEKLLKSILGIVNEDKTEKSGTEDESDSEVENLDKDQLVISQDEWDLLSDNNGPVKYKYLYYREEVIIKEGNKYDQIFKIQDGVCRIEKYVPNPQEGEPTSLVLGFLYPGAIFGVTSFFSDQFEETSVVCDSAMVEIVTIDNNYINTKVFPINPKAVLKFYHFTCGTIASFITQRESKGWSRFQNDDESSGDSQEMTPATLRSRRRNFADIKYRISYKDEEEKEYKEAILIIDKGFASIFTPTQELITRLDLLEYVIVPLPKFMEFTLVNNNNVHHLFSVNDLPLFDHIILRVYNESILAQTSFINNAPPEFAKFANSNFNKKLHSDAVEIKIGESEWQPATAILVCDNIRVFRDVKTKPTFKVNILFGIPFPDTEDPTIFRVISDLVVEFKCPSANARDQWINSISSVRAALYSHDDGIKAALQRRANV